jgi:hypothetical protein
MRAERAIFSERLSWFAVLDVQHLAAYGKHRIERGHGVLEYHRDAVAPDFAQFILAHPEHVAPLELHHAAFNPGVVGQEVYKWR